MNHISLQELAEEQLKYFSWIILKTNIGGFKWNESFLKFIVNKPLWTCFLSFSHKFTLKVNMYQLLWTYFLTQIKSKYLFYDVIFQCMYSFPVQNFNQTPINFFSTKYWHIYTCPYIAIKLGIFKSLFVSCYLYVWKIIFVWKI